MIEQIQLDLMPETEKILNEIISEYNQQSWQEERLCLN